ncbi:hypothetical protein NEIRO03_0194 [Nematocida sp. AWRm78]|nr:hypothetical protein NEIRO02_0195 [Nematocida sp. AWRm79]KAI5182530.1 hypothetical protein NEIRO03_0194 [Nematocida sp. AWRm78]
MEVKERKEENTVEDHTLETEEEQIRKRREEYTKLSEKDEIIFSASAILYRFQLETKSWVGRGKGKLRVSLEPTSKKYRITQIREKVFKLGCNHYIEATTVLSKYPLAEHSWIWTTFGDDCGDGLDRAQKYLARFSTLEEAEDFFNAVEKGRKTAEGAKKEPVSEKKDVKNLESEKKDDKKIESEKKDVKNLESEKKDDKDIDSEKKDDKDSKKSSDSGVEAKETPEKEDDNSEKKSSKKDESS